MLCWFQKQDCVFFFIVSAVTVQCPWQGSPDRQVVNLYLKMFHMNIISAIHCRAMGRSDNCSEMELCICGCLSGTLHLSACKLLPEKWGVLGKRPELHSPVTGLLGLLKKHSLLKKMEKSFGENKMDHFWRCESCNEPVHPSGGGRGRQPGHHYSQPDKLPPLRHQGDEQECRGRHRPRQEKGYGDGWFISVKVIRLIPLRPRPSVWHFLIGRWRHPFSPLQVLWCTGSPFPPAWAQMGLITGARTGQRPRPSSPLRHSALIPPPPTTSALCCHGMTYIRDMCAAVVRSLNMSFLTGRLSSVNFYL